jgi:predicted metal-binding membrane protein
MAARVTTTALRRDRFIILAGLAAVSALAWAYMFYLTAQMAGMDMNMAAMSQIQPWGPTDLLLTFIMWTVMMVAMMTPSATPMVLTFAGINRQRQAKKQPLVPTGIFLLGYLFVWAGFSALATTFQWGLHSAALLSPMMVTTSPILGGVILLAAGIFQFTPLKHACLATCRTPMGFILTEWREGRSGAFVMGFKHGRFCLGCCWFLMALLFVAGVMNLLWVAAIAALVLIEKVAPSGEWVSRVTGLLLIVLGVWILASGLITII